MKSESKRLTVYIDGASRGNPGFASVGVAFLDEKGQSVHNLSKKIGITTNNTAEYAALVMALQAALMMKVEELEVFTDSELLAKQMSGEYKVKEESLKVLHLFANHLRGGFKKVSIQHVPREKNKLADKLANQALDETLV